MYPVVLTVPSSLMRYRTKGGDEIGVSLMPVKSSPEAETADFSVSFTTGWI